MLLLVMSCTVLLKLFFKFYLDVLASRVFSSCVQQQCTFPVVRAVTHVKGLWFGLTAPSCAEIAHIIALLPDKILSSCAEIAPKTAYS